MKKSFKIILIIVAVIVALRLILPPVILHFANRTLATMKGYRGHIEDIDLAIIRGAYKIDSIYLNKVDSATSKETPFFAASLIDLSVEWKALFHGSIVGELIFENPVIRFTKEKVEPKDLQNDSSSFKQLLDDFMPLQVNRVEIKQGDVQYVDEFSKPKVDIRLTQLNAIALNLRNSYDSAVLLPAKLRATAEVYEGQFIFNMKLNPLADDPTFDMNAELKEVNLVKLNEFFQAYAKVDVNKGTFGMYTEIAAKEAKFKGYVKPLIKELDILGKEDRDNTILKKAWEGLVGSVGQILKNQPNDQFATKVPFEGRLDNPDTSLITAVINILQNAFVRALQPSLDNEIGIESVDNAKEEKPGLLKKIFGNKKDGDKKEKK